MFSTKAEYGVRIMAQLAAPAIADAEGLPLAYLEHLVQSLRRAQLVDSRRGAHGGYTLSRPADSITMAEVVEDAAGHHALRTRCPEQEASNGMSLEIQSGKSSLANTIMGNPYVYNQPEDVDRLVEALLDARRVFEL